MITVGDFYRDTDDGDMLEVVGYEESSDTWLLSRNGVTLSKTVDSSYIERWFEKVDPLVIKIQVSGGTAYAYWDDEIGEREEFIGEISSHWLETHAARYFTKELGRPVVIEVENL